MGQSVRNEDLCHCESAYFHKLRDLIDQDHKKTIVNALHLAARAYDEDRRVMEQTAACLRDGVPCPPFADGEAGARAADGLAERFMRQANEALFIAESLED
jgi:hypothetical protein